METKTKINKLIWQPIGNRQKTNSIKQNIGKKTITSVGRESHHSFTQITCR